MLAAFPRPLTGFERREIIASGEKKKRVQIVKTSKDGEKKLKKMEKKSNLKMSKSFSPTEQKFW